MLRRKKRMLSGLLAMAMVLSWLGGVPAAAAGPVFRLDRSVFPG